MRCRCVAPRVLHMCKGCALLMIACRMTEAVGNWEPAKGGLPLYQQVLQVVMIVDSAIRNQVIQTPDLKVWLVKHDMSS